ncbi:hypothetical protein SH2C18_52330 [Clostridium sediminicola]
MKTLKTMIKIFIGKNAVLYCVFTYKLDKKGIAKLESIFKK